MFYQHRHIYINYIKTIKVICNHNILIQIIIDRSMYTCGVWRVIMILVFRKTNEWLCDEQNVIQYIRMRSCRNNNTETALIPTIQFWGEKGAANSQSAVARWHLSKQQKIQVIFCSCSKVEGGLWCEQGGATRWESDASPLPFWAEAAAVGKRGPAALPRRMQPDDNVTG